MTDNYWKDYTEFITNVESITKLSPSTLLELYNDFIESLEESNNDNYTFKEFELDNDFHFRVQIQNVLNNHDLLSNELRNQFAERVFELDRRIKLFLTADCKQRNDWYKNIELNIDR